MAFKKMEAEKVKLGKGDSVQGYLLACKPWGFTNDEGEKVELASAMLQTDKGIVKVNIGGDYSALLAVGFMTRISRKTRKVDGEEKPFTEVEQDQDDSITVKK